jgi:hypothetical protein
VLNGGYNEAPDIERGTKRAGRLTVELFNLADDPYEQKNVADANPERLKVLRARYDALASQAVAPKIRPRPADFVVPSVWGEPVREKGRRP